MQVRPRNHSWDDLQTADPVSEEERRVDATFAATFGTIAGQKTLEYLHLLTTWKRNRPGDSDGALREAEAKRRLVAEIEARIERHSKTVTATSGGRRTPERSGPSRRRTTVSARRGTPDATG